MAGASRQAGGRHRVIPGSKPGLVWPGERRVSTIFDMTEETGPPNEPDPDTTPAAEPDPGTVEECSLCGAPAPEESRAVVARQIVCLECRDKVEDELKAQQAGAASLVPAIAGALAGAMIAAVIWAAIVVITDFEVGYVALAVGWLAGKGAVLGAGGKKGVPLQVVAVLASVLGLVLGKYFSLAHDAKVEFGWSYFDSRIVDYFTENLGEFFGGFDILWVVLAIGVAYKIPAPPKVDLGRSRSD